VTGDVNTVSVAAALNTPPAMFVTATRYAPESFIVSAPVVKLGPVAPAMLVPFNCH
jgi:hypothetical protein